MRPVDVLNQEPRLAICEKSVRKCVASMDEMDQETIPAGSLGIAFVTEAECSRLHSTFFEDPDVTDVMTFPGEPDDQHAGDIAICPAVAAAAATDSGLPFKEELTLYLVHAWLHLAGMEDQSDPGRADMRAAETRLMRLLRTRNCLLEATWTS